MISSCAKADKTIGVCRWGRLDSRRKRWEQFWDQRLKIAELIENHFGINDVQINLSFTFPRLFLPSVRRYVYACSYVSACKCVLLRFAVELETQFERKKDANPFMYYLNYLSKTTLSYPLASLDFAFIWSWRDQWLCSGDGRRSLSDATGLWIVVTLRCVLWWRKPARKGPTVDQWQAVRLWTDLNPNEAQVTPVSWTSWGSQTLSPLFLSSSQEQKSGRKTMKAWCHKTWDNDKEGQKTWKHLKEFVPFTEMFLTVIVLWLNCLKTFRCGISQEKLKVV